MKIEVNNLTTADTSFLSLMGGEHSSVITEIPIINLLPYPNQPFNVEENNELEELAEDIKLNGVLFPVIVRPLDGQYQILAGHRRTRASQLAQLESVPCIVKDVSEAVAKLIVTNTNLTHRQKLLPSERAFAYLMQKEAYEELGTHSVRTTSKIAEENEESVRMVQYYLKLTKLCKPLLTLVDTDIIGVKIGATLSSIPINEQEVLSNFMLNRKIKLTELQSKQVLALTEVTEEELNNIFFPTGATQGNELKYDTYIFNVSSFSKTIEDVRNVQYAEKLIDGVVLEKKKYAKVLLAQSAIEKQLQLIEKIINEK